MSRSVGGRFVVAIGIDAYKHHQPLRNAVADARSALALFERLGFAPARPPLVDGEATGRALLRLVTDDLAALSNDDSLVVLFAGHGGTRVQPLDATTEIKTGFLIPIDGESEGYTSWINLDHWLDQLARLPPRHILVVIDTCHSGLALGSVIKYRDVQKVERRRLDALARRRSRRVITSAADDELAQDGGPVPDHSLFMGCLLEALEGELAQPDRDVVTGSELGVHLQRRVVTLSRKLQTPDFGAFAHDQRGELMIPVLTPEAKAEVEPAREVVPKEKLDEGEDSKPDAELDGRPASNPEASSARVPAARHWRIALALGLAGLVLTGTAAVAKRVWRDEAPMAPGARARPSMLSALSPDLAVQPPARVALVASGIPATAAELERRVAARDLATVQALLSASVDANAQGEVSFEPCWYGRGQGTVLTRAVLDGEVEIARALLEAGAAASAIAYEGGKPAAASEHRTPLLAAARCSAKQHAELVELLLEHRADARARTQLGESVLFRCRAPRTIAALVAAGAPVDALSANGRTALMTAAEDGDAALVDALLGAGADPNVAAGGETALSLAVERQPALVPRLLASGARLDGDVGALVLRAIGDGSAVRLAATRELIARGARLDARYRGRPLLDHLLAREERGGARALIELGADAERVVRAAAASLAAARYAEALRDCSLVADAIESTEAAWICAQASCGLGDLTKARSYAARSAADRRDRFENLCANMSP